MEAVPRMPMLSFELKQCPEYVDFGPVLKQYIRDHYGEDPAHYNKACSDIEQLRQSAVHVSHDFMGCSTLKKYYAQLQLLQGRFPMGEEGECAINFTWEDVFLGREVTIPDIKFEQACILYNIGALHSILGSIETRQSADGMKVACTHFQCAAWAFEYLRDHFGSSNLSVDMSHEVLSFQVSLMLAQAQECILEKSMIDSRKNTITAKVSAQVVEFYRNVIKSIQTENMDAILGSRKYKDWKRRADLKILFYEVITNYYMGKNSEDQEKFGECVAHLTLSIDKLKECAKLAKSESSDIQESLRFANDVVGGKYQSAKKDNDYVYHEKIPPADSLPEVKGASLVKGIPFNWNDPEVSGPDIFQKLVPMSAHEASSMYSEEKAKLLRQVGTDIEEKNVALLKFMSSLNLESSKLNFEPERLPQDLLEKCAAVSVKQNAIKDLVEAMGAVSNAATEVQMAIEEINTLLENDIQEEEEFQKQYGKRGGNPMLPEIKKECDRFEEGHRKGNQSNVDLHKAMNTHIINLKLLAGPLEDIKNHLPSLERDRDPESDAIIKELKRLMDKVDEMKTQRSMLEDQFRNKVKNDDITNQIVAQDGGSNTMVMFGEQLKKHDQVIGFIHQNLEAQDKILSAMTDVNARYANTRKATAETIARRDATIEGLKNSFDVYEDLLAKSQKGLDFYKKLESNINRLLERCRGICKQQAEERQQIVDRLKPKEPPPRPVAQKPTDSSPQVLGQTSIPSTLPSDMATGALPTGPTGALGAMPDFHPSPGFEGPKLKDYLPFMKPKTFGKGKVDTGSLPTSLISSPVHLPTNPDSVPASPQHGMAMSDDEIRKLGITDPQVLAMIRAHSLPPSGPSSGFSHQIDGVGQAVSYPSPSQSPSMQGGMPSTVRFDRGTKPSTATQHFRPQGTLPSQPRMPHPSVSQYQPNQAGGYQSYVSQTQSGIHPNMPQVQGGINATVSYPSPVQSPIPSSLPPNSNMPQTGSGIPPTVQGGVIPHVSQSLSTATQQNYQPPAPSQQEYPTSDQPLSSQSNYQQPTSIPGSQHGLQYSNQPSMGLAASVVSTQQNLPHTSTTSANFYTGQQSGGHFIQPQQSQVIPPSGHPVPQQVAQTTAQPGGVYTQQPQVVSQGSVQPPQSQIVPPSGHPANVGILPPVYGDALHDRMNQTQSGQRQSSQTGTQIYDQQQPQMTTRSIHQPQQNIQYQQTQPGHAQSVQSTEGQGQGQIYQQQHQPSQGQTYQPQMSQPIGPNQTSVSLPVQFQPGLPTLGNLSQTLPSASVQGQITNSGRAMLPQQQGTQPIQTIQYGQQQPRFINPGQQGPMYQPRFQGQDQIHQGQPGVPAQPQGYRFQQPQQNQPSGQEANYQYPQQGYMQQQTPTQSQLSQGQNQQNIGQIQQNQGQAQLSMKGQNTQLTSQGQTHFLQQQPQGLLQGQMISSQQPQNQNVPAQQQYSQQQQQVGQQNLRQTQQTTSQQTLPHGQQYQPSQQTTMMGQSSQQSQQNVFPSQQPTQISQGYNVQGQGQIQSGQNASFSGHSQSSQGQSFQQPQPSDQGQNYSFPGNQQGYQLPRQQVPTQQYNVPHVTSVPASTQQISRPNVPQQMPQTSTQFSHSQQIIRPQVPQASQPGYVQQPQGQQMTQMPQGGQFQQQQQPPAPVPQHSMIGQPGASQIPVSSMTSQVNAMTTQQQFMTNSNQLVRPGTGQSLKNLTPAGTGAPQGSYSSTLQQLNPLSPPDILPQPILPSPLKPVSEFQPPIQEVQAEVTKPSHDIHPRARESPTSQRKQPEKTHSRSSSNTSQPELRLHRQHSSSSIGSSLDDILSSSPTDSTIKPVDSVLTPKVLTAQEIAQQKEEALLKGTLGRQFSKDPYPDATKINKFIAETEKLAKIVESLSKATCSGPSHLAIAWKEIIEDHDIHGKKHSMAIGRCYPMKNRDQDVMPYDESRVLLTSHKDDYINASWINDLAESCPKFIATQAPLHSTLFDFWLMVYEQGSEVIVMLSSEMESRDTKKYPEYWPPEKGKLMHHGPITLTLQSVKDQQLWTERIIHLQHQQTKQGRTIVQLQYKNWPVSGFPEKVNSLLQFINEVHNLYRQQRSLLKPVMVHCSNGIGRTGTFLMIYTGMQEIDHGNGIVNIQTVAKKMLQQRRYIIREKSQLKFCHEAILYHGEDILAKQGILVHKASFGDKLPQPGEKSYHWTPTDDVVFGSYSLSDLKSSVEKLGLKLDSADQKKRGVSSEEVEKDHRPSLPSKTEDKPPYSSLPDVVQRTDTARPENDREQKLNEISAAKSSLSGSNASLLSIGSESDKMPGSPIQKIKSRDSSPKPGSLHGSHEGSPKMQSLLDLQNPSTFTLGADGGKKKITKASFLDKTTNLSDGMDPSDPLASLDPLWTMKSEK